MLNQGREIFVLTPESISDEEVEQLNMLFKTVESPEAFCIAHELVDRNRITVNAKKILRESNHYRLKPFRFLINKN